MQKIKVGVVGTGIMGSNHARVYSELPNCELVGIADINTVLVDSIAYKYHTKAYYDYGDLLNAGVEAVSIAVPTIFHADVASFFLRNGIHCLVEKPISVNCKDGEMLVEIARKMNKTLMIGHIERFNPAVQKMKDIIDSGKLGDVIIITSRRVGPHPPRITDVGIIIDLATHDIDIARYLYGKEPVKIYSKFGSIKYKHEDHVIVLLDFGKGVASIEANWFTPHKVRTAVVTGTDGIAYVDYINQTISIFNSQCNMEPKIEKEEPLKREITHFVECVETGKTPLVTGNDGVKTLKVAINALNT